MKIDYSRRIFGLDVMRAVAILLVLFSHTSLLMYPEMESLILTIIRFFGAIGVDIFFVLSGFLIGGILLKMINAGKSKGKDMLYFLVRRWLRTLPNYYLILIINVLLAVLVFKESLKGVSWFFVFLQNFATSQMDFFTESWSLSIEEFAYIIGPVLLLLFFFLLKKMKKTKIFLLVTILIIVMISLFRWSFHINEEVVDQSFWSHNLRKVVIYRIDSIYYGFIAAYIAMKYEVSWKNMKIAGILIGSLLFFGMHAFIFLKDLRPENAAFFYNILYLPLVFVSIAMFLPWLSNWSKGTVLKGTITWISLLSYSLYLVNYSIVLLLMNKFFDVSAMSNTGKYLMSLAFWVISLSLSYVLFRYYEKPMMNLRDKRIILDKFT